MITMGSSELLAHSEPFIKEIGKQNFPSMRSGYVILYPNMPLNAVVILTEDLKPVKTLIWQSDFGLTGSACV